MDTIKSTPQRLIPLRQQAIKQFYAALARWESLEEHAQKHLPDLKDCPPCAAPVSFLPFRHAEYIMTPKHPRWDEFIERMEGSNGCDFTQDEKEHTTWICHGGIDKRFAAAILYDMGDIDVTQSLIWFEQNGGHCDCEILLNCIG